MPVYITAAELLNYSMFYMGLLNAWAVIKGLEDA
jgi:hypothetical protein